jgi:hypothetical protein
MNKNIFLFPVLLTLCFFALSLLGILHHEIWLDEAHSFVLSKDSSSFLDLIVNTRQEGHPMIWYILLWLVSKVSHEVLGMQLLHIGISTLSVFLMARFAPFSNIKKILFAFSYFFFYEYNIISRNYALGILFVTLYLLLICREYKNYPLIALSLLLLANSHFIGLILSIPLAIVCLLLLGQEEKPKFQSVWFTYGILLAGFILGIVQVLPQEDSIFSHLPKPGYFSVERLSAFTVPFKAFYHFPDLLATYTWNTNIFTANKFIGVLFALLFPVVLIKAFGNKPLSLLVVVLASLGISLFFYTELMYNYTVRHWGYIFLAYYAAVWLQYGMDQTKYTLYWNRFLPRYFTIESKGITQGLFYSTLIIQVAAACYAYTLDLNKNFCNAKEAANYIQQHHAENDLIILSSFMSGTAVSAYLDKPLYYPEYKGWGSYGKWNTPSWQVSREELLKQIHELNNHKQAYLLLDYKVFEPTGNKQAGQVVFDDEDCSIVYITSFDDGIINHEQFEFYKIAYKK